MDDIFKSYTGFRTDGDLVYSDQDLYDRLHGLVQVDVSDMSESDFKYLIDHKAIKETINEWEDNPKEYWIPTADTFYAIYRVSITDKIEDDRIFDLISDNLFITPSSDFTEEDSDTLVENGIIHWYDWWQLTYNGYGLMFKYERESTIDEIFDDE